MPPLHWNEKTVEKKCGFEVGTRVWAARAANAADSTCPASASLHPIEFLKQGDLVLNHEATFSEIQETVTSQIEDWFVDLRTDSHTIRLLQSQRVLARLRPRTLGGSRDWSASPEEHRERRRELRRESTMAERKLWSVLRGSTMGFKFRRQHSLGPYIADFYCREAHLVVEVDGEHHYTERGRRYDLRRDKFLRELGLDVLRIPVHELDDNLDGVWQAIERQCRLRTESVDGAYWVQAGALQPGDFLYDLSEAAAALRVKPLRLTHTEWSGATICRFKLAEPCSIATEACVVCL